MGEVKVKEGTTFKDKLGAKATTLWIVLALVLGFFLGTTFLLYENVVALDSYEPDDTPAQASPIPTDGTLQSHDFDPNNDEDWLNFSATNGMLYTIETHNLIDADTYIYLYDTDGTTILEEDDDGGVGSASKIIWTAPRDDNFYVMIEEYYGSSGPTYTYDVNITESVVPPGDIYEPDNDPGNATAIPTDGTIQNHTFHIYNDQDWMNFTASNGVTYKIETHNLTDADTIIALVDSDGMTLITWDDDGGIGVASKIVWTAPRDDYFYVGVAEKNENSGPTYTYDINITETSAPSGDAYEPDNNPGEASPIPTDGTTQSHNFHVLGDEDWVNFTATMGTMYIIETHNLGSADTYIYLYDSDGTTILDEDDDSGFGSASKIVWTAPRDDNFYVMIEEYYGFGGPTYTYDIDIIISGAPGGDAYEPDNNPVDASPIQVDGTVQSHNFHVSGDEDWLVFAVMSGRIYTIETHNLGDADTEIYLYDSDRVTQLGYDDDGGVGSASKIVWTAPRNDLFYVLIVEVFDDYGPTYTYDINITEKETTTEPPGAPINLIATAGDSYVSLTWSAPSSDGGSPIINYRIYRSTISSQETFLEEIGNVLYYNDASVINGITYYYKVSAKNSVGEGPLTNEISATPVSFPTEPTNLIASSGDSYINLTWDEPISDGGSPITNYRIYRGATSGHETFLAEIGNVTFYNDTSVTNGIIYYYNVSAINSIGEGPLTNEVSETPVGVPTTPTGLIVLSGDSYVYITWNAPFSDGGSSISNYRIYRATTSGQETLLSEIGNLRRYNDTSVTNGIVYYYRVSAKNSVGEGPLTKEASATPMTSPSAPTDITASTRGSYIYVSWTAPTSNGGASITNYRIYRGTTQGEETFLAEIGNVSYYIDRDVEEGEKYYYKVCAKNTVGEGSSSIEVDATVKEKPTDELPWLWIIVIIIIVAIVIAALVAYMVHGKKGVQPPGQIPQQPLQPAQMLPPQRRPPPQQLPPQRQPPRQPMPLIQQPQRPPQRTQPPRQPTQLKKAPQKPPLRQQLPQQPSRFPPPPPPTPPPQQGFTAVQPKVASFSCPHCRKLFTVQAPKQTMVIACPFCGGQTTVGPQ